MRYLIFTIGLLASNMLGAQQWGLFPNDRAYYQDVNTGIIYTTEFKSTEQVGDGVLRYFLNEKPVLIKDEHGRATPGAMENDFGAYWELNSPINEQTWGPDNKWKMTTNLTENLQWPIEPEFAAICESIAEEVVFENESTEDNVANIKIGNSGLMRVGEEYGLLEFQHAGMHLKLLGVVKGEVATGWKLPKLKDFFVYQVGDYFENYTDDITAVFEIRQSYSFEEVLEVTESGYSAEESGIEGNPYVVIEPENLENDGPMILKQGTVVAPKTVNISNPIQEDDTYETGDMLPLDMIESHGEGVFGYVEIKLTEDGRERIHIKRIFKKENEEYVQSSAFVQNSDEITVNIDKGIGLSQVKLAYFEASYEATRKLIDQEGYQWWIDFMLRVGVNDPSAISFQMYPNPSNGMINIHGLNDGENYQLEIRDMAGKLVGHQVLGGAITVREELKEGIYLVSLVSEEGVRSTEKLVVRK